MSDLFQAQLPGLRACSLHRKLRKLGTAQGPEVQIVGRQLFNFPRTIISGWRGSDAVSRGN